jgi:serine-threonine kinase receptor-associated protein
MKAAAVAPLICSGHSRPVPDLAYSNATEDGIFIISACLDGKPMVRNGDTGDWVGTFQGHKGAVWSARLNSTATQAVTGSADYSAKYWDALTGSCLHTWPHSKIVKTVDFSPDDKLVSTAGFEKIIRIFDLATIEAEPIHTFTGHEETVKIVLWAPPTSPYTLISGGGDAQIRIWDLKTKTQVRAISTGAPITSLSLSKDFKYLVSTAGKTIAFWDPTTFTEIKKITTKYNLHTAALSDNHAVVVAGGDDLSVHLYDFETGNELEAHRGHHGPVHCLKFAPSNKTFSSGSEDGTIRIWQAPPSACPAAAAAAASSDNSN